MTRTWSGLTVALLSEKSSTASFAAEGTQHFRGKKNQSQPRITSQERRRPSDGAADRPRGVEVSCPRPPGAELKHIAEARQAIGKRRTTQPPVTSLKASSSSPSSKAFCRTRK